MFANNFAQPAPDPVSYNRAPECARGDKAGPKANRILCRNDAEQNQLAAVNTTVLFYPLEFRGQR
jgi:hypothetical protein